MDGEWIERKNSRSICSNDRLVSFFPWIDCCCTYIHVYVFVWVFVWYVVCIGVSVYLTYIVIIFGKQTTRTKRKKNRRIRIGLFLPWLVWSDLGVLSLRHVHDVDVVTCFANDLPCGAVADVHDAMIRDYGDGAIASNDPIFCDATMCHSCSHTRVMRTGGTKPKRNKLRKEKKKKQRWKETRRLNIWHLLNAKWHGQRAEIQNIN